MGRRSELEREQAYVTMLYERLDGLRERTRRQLERALRPDGGGHLQARLDRDAAGNTSAQSGMPHSANQRASSGSIGRSLPSAPRTWSSSSLSRRSP